MASLFSSIMQCRLVQFRTELDARFIAMKNIQLLKSSIECLKMIREELHDDIDSGKRNKLEKVICDLESCAKGTTPDQLLEMLGQAISYVPAIERLIKALSEF